MTTDSSSNGPQNVNYGSNSRTAKKADAPERVVPTAVVPAGAAVTRKKSIGRKFREQFAGDDAQTVGQFLLFEVVIPATKNLIFDLGREGLQRMLFGGTSRPTSSSVVGSVMGSARTSYSAYSRSGATTRQASQPTSGMSPQQRAMHDFSGVILETREQAVLVLDVLTDLIEQYDTATVNDFYAATGQTSDFTSMKYGWVSLADANIRHIGREGYLLEMPRPVLLE